MRKTAFVLALVFAAAAVLVPVSGYAATNPSFTQVINAGTQSIDIVDGTGTAVASPSVAFGAVNFDFACQTATGTLAPSTGTVNKIAVKNPKKSGIKVDLNAVTPATDKWTSGTDNYSYRDATSSGCATGQLTVGTGTFTKTAGSGTPTQTTPGGSFSSTSSVTLLNNTGTTAYNAELTDYSLSQKIPAEQASGSYTLPMNITFIAQ
ncbi:MAG: hypothetical protein QG629_641 [Patescibacteria group bacterium]|nr:hypothetical protein [Candidatus Saccharibacteria bacterium]MDQ5963559.1 hypothetical protein [Patescibacteria group bacterium]